MRLIQFSNLDEVFECYGRGNMVAIDSLPQIIYYTKHGCQPKYLCENEFKQGKLTAWFHKDETKFVYNKWLESFPKK